MALVVGFDAEVAINTGTFGVPVWTPVKGVRETTRTLEKAEADVTSRGSKYRRMKSSLKDVTFEIEALWDSTNTELTTLRNHYLNNTIVDIVLADGLLATSGTTGFRAECEVFGYTWGEPLEEALTVSISFRPTTTANDATVPSYLTV